MNLKQIAALRPGSPVEALARAVGAAWEAPGAESEGAYWGPGGAGAAPLFSARIDVNGRLGSIGFHGRFPEKHEVEGLHLGMSLAEALIARPGLQRQPTEPGERDDIPSYRDRTAAGDRLDARFIGGRLRGFDLSRPEAVYPERPYKRADPRLTQAFDIWATAQRPLPRRTRDASWAHGWSHGLPPGIASEQWPISTANGQPLRHAFTLHLPPAYRAQGPQQVALSLFVDDQFELLEPLEGDAAAEPSPHPHSHRLKDEIGTAYVAIWLTQAEFDAPLAEPPPPSPAVAGRPRPQWLERAYADCDGFDAPCGEDRRRLPLLSGDAATAGLGSAFALVVTERLGDPNAGRPAREWSHQNEMSGYVPAFSEAGQALQLERFHGMPAHLGGTMFPVQGYPDFSPYFLEFEEDFAGFNFGGGAAQLDLLQMQIDWACG